MLRTAFPGGLSLRLAFVSFFSFFYPHPSSPFIFLLINQCDRCLVPLAWGAHGWNAQVYQGLACSRRSDSRVRCLDGGERVKSYAEEMRGKTRREWGEFPPFSIFSPVFFPRQFFDRALLSECLEQANQGLALPKLEAPRQTRHPPPLNDAVAR